MKKPQGTNLNRQRGSPLKVAGKEVQIFQDLPTSLLRKRREFDFLSQILPKKVNEREGITGKSLLLMKLHY